MKLLCQPSGDPSEGTADSWTPDDRETVSCGHATKGEDPWHFDAFFFFFCFFLLHLVPRREDPTSPISNRDFKGFREDYSVKVIIFEDTIASRSLILPIFFFFYRELYSLSV